MCFLFANVIVNIKLSDERFDMMSQTYEAEQKELEAEVIRLQKEIEVQETQIQNIEKFIQKFSQYVGIGASGKPDHRSRFSRFTFDVTISRGSPLLIIVSPPLIICTFSPFRQAITWIWNLDSRFSSRSVFPHQSL